MLFDLALPTAPVHTEWIALATDSDSAEDWTPAEKKKYEGLIAKGIPAAVARKMCKATETARPQFGISLATVPADLRADARQKAADEGEAMPDGSYPIRSLAELTKAQESFGQTKPEDRPKVKRFLLKRAKALGAGQNVVDAIGKYGDED